jgi:pimeloyl-ACP methyl ester carboxylesterase
MNAIFIQYKMKATQFDFLLMIRLKFSLAFAFMMVAAAFNSTAATSFEVKVFGKGEPMILIPGIGCSGDVWKSTVVHYENQYECHVLTLAGFAGVPPIESDWFLDQVKNDLIAYIKENHLKKPIVIGHSMGGFIALWIASTEPDLLGKVVVVDALPFLPAAFYANATPQTSAQFANQLKQKLLAQSDEQFRQNQQANFRMLITDTATADAAAKWGEQSDKATVAEVTYEMQTIDLREEIAKIKCPVLVFATWIEYKPAQTHDGIAAVFNAQYAELKSYQLVVDDNARHFVMLDDPAGFLGQVDSFLTND